MTISQYYYIIFIKFIDYFFYEYYNYGVVNDMIRKSKIEENKSLKEKKLFDTAFKLFTEKGIKNTSIQEIVDNAGIAKGTFYLYFKDKYELQDELIARKSYQLFNNALKKLNKENIKKFDDQIIFIIDYIIDHLSKNKLLLKFISKNLSFGLYNEKIIKLMDDNNIKIRELFINGIHEHNINIKNPDVTLFMIIELVSSTCFSSIMNKEPLPINEYKPFLYDNIKIMLNSK